MSRFQMLWTWHRRMAEDSQAAVTHKPLSREDNPE